MTGKGTHANGFLKTKNGILRNPNGNLDFSNGTKILCVSEVIGHSKSSEKMTGCLGKCSKSNFITQDLEILFFQTLHSCHLPFPSLLAGLWRPSACREENSCCPAERDNLTHKIHQIDIYPHEWLIFMVHVGKYTIHGSYGWCNVSSKRCEFFSNASDLLLVVTFCPFLLEKFESNLGKLSQVSGGKKIVRFFKKFGYTPT